MDDTRGKSKDDSHQARSSGQHPVEGQTVEGQPDIPILNQNGAAAGDRGELS